MPTGSSPLRTEPTVWIVTFVRFRNLYLLSSLKENISLIKVALMPWIFLLLGNAGFVFVLRQNKPFPLVHEVKIAIAYESQILFVKTVYLFSMRLWHIYTNGEYLNRDNKNAFPAYAVLTSPLIRHSTFVQLFTDLINTSIKV